MDAGCLQKDFVRIDWENTIRAWEQFLKYHPQRLVEEQAWLDEVRPDLVVSDVPSFPFKVAGASRIPSLLISNFTWHDIYFPQLEKLKRLDLIKPLEEEYPHADLHLMPQCHFKSTLAAQSREIGFIAIRGENIRDRLEDDFKGRLKNKKLVFIYLGQFDATQLNWQRLEAFKDYHFLTRDPLELSSLPDNLSILDARYKYPDLVASSDIVCTKAGYSTLATAFSHYKPVISCDRFGFAEIDVMKDYLNAHQIGIVFGLETFMACDWSAALKKAEQLSVKGKVPLNGEKTVRELIDRQLKSAHSVS